MIRNLKILMLTAMAVSAFVAFSASGAQAAEFHCTPPSGNSCTATLEKDGTGKTAHHVFEITNVKGASTAITCNEITGHATASAKTVADLTFTSVAYHGCTFVGQEATVKMNGCGYTFFANGNVNIVNCGGKSIELSIPTCTVKINEQESTGITYANLGASPNRTVTAQAKVTVNVASLEGAECGIAKEPPYIGHYTTGNTIVKVEEDIPSGGKEIDGWWA